MSTKRGHERAKQAADKAERQVAEWTRKMAELVLHIAGDIPDDFTIEDVRSFCPPMPKGTDARAWGHVTRLALKLGYIERTGRYAPATSSNGSPKPLYRIGAAAP